MKNNLYPIYQLLNICKDYGTRRVLDIDILNIQEGETLAVVGPSGSGKSTLLRLLNFLETPTNGELIFRGVRFSSGREMPLDLRRRVTTVFQRPMVLEGNVRSNVTYGLRLRGQHDSQELVYSVLEEVGLENLATMNARTLSGGEIQRVALARSMILKPDVLLLDEPTANLDPYNVGLIERIITGLRQERQTTIILVTHNVFQAQRLADRVIFILEGKIVEDSDVSHFFNSPRDTRTAAFIHGEMVY
jgi:tungstate transport system ATP-binding protein